MELDICKKTQNTYWWKPASSCIWGTNNRSCNDCVSLTAPLWNQHEQSCRGRAVNPSELDVKITKLLSSYVTSTPSSPRLCCLCWTDYSAWPITPGNFIGRHLYVFTRVFTCVFTDLWYDTWINVAYHCNKIQEGETAEDCWIDGWRLTECSFEGLCARFVLASMRPHFARIFSPLSFASPLILSCCPLFHFQQSKYSQHLRSSFKLGLTFIAVY